MTASKQARKQARTVKVFADEKGTSLEVVKNQMKLVSRHDKLMKSKYTLYCLGFSHYVSIKIGHCLQVAALTHGKR